MGTMAMAAFLKPFAVLLFMVLIGLPARYVLGRWMKPGRLKTALLWRLERGRRGKPEGCWCSDPSTPSGGL